MQDSSSSAAASLPIHRFRFVPFSPSVPTALALSPHPYALTGRSLLAIGRQNGNIDLCAWVSGQADSLEKGWCPISTLISSGRSPRKIDSLAFAVTDGENYGPETLRLFSISGGSNLEEHILPSEISHVSRAPLRQIQSARKPYTSRTLSSQGGIIWCMAVSPLARYIALGCEDGHIRFVDIRQGKFEHLSHSNAARGGSGETVSRTDRCSARIVSLAWGPPNRKAKAPQRPIPGRPPPQASGADSSVSDSDSSDEDDEDWSESFVLAGTASSTALLYNLATGRVLQKLLLPKARNEHTIVWSVAVLPDRTLVTGDSLGSVTFYDAATRVPLSNGRFQVHDKGADVLCLAIGSKGRTVYSGSVDQKVSEFAYLGQKWVHTASRRLHAHDIKALVLDPPISLGKPSTARDSRVPVLISASADFNVVLTPAAPPSQTNLISSKSKKSKLQVTGAAFAEHTNPVSSNEQITFAATTQRRLPYVPTSSACSSLAGAGCGEITSCSARRWTILRTESTIQIWQVSQQEASGSSINQGEASYTQILEMQFSKRLSKLISHSISPDGNFLAVSDLHGTKVFSLRETLGELEPKRLKSFESLFSEQGAPASSALTFSPDGRLIMASWPTGVIYVISVSATDSCEIVKAWSAAQAVHGSRAMAGRSISAANGMVNGNGKASSDSEQGSEDDGENDDDEASTRAFDGRIDHLVITKDLQYVICSSANHVWMYNLDILAPKPRVLPSLASRSVGIACHPKLPGVAVAALQDGSVRVLRLDETQAGHKLDPVWRSLQLGVAEKIATIRDCPAGICWIETSAEPVLVVYGATWLLTARPTAPGTLANGHGPNQASLNKRRSRLALATEASDESPSADGDDETKYWNVRLTHRYQPLVHVSPWLAEDGSAGLAVVERPFFELAKNMGAAWKRERVFGR